MAGYLSTFSAFALLADVESIRTGKLKQCLYIYVPFSFCHCLLLSIAEFIYNHAIVVMVFVCVAACDTLFILIFLNVLMKSAIVGRDLKDLDAMLEDPKAEPNIIRTKLREYLTMHLKYNE